MQDNQQDDVEETDCSFSYLDLWNDEKTTSAWNLLDPKNPLPTGVDPSEVLQKRKPEKPNPRIWVAIDDLNNSDAEPNVNKSKNALEIGIEFDF